MNFTRVYFDFGSLSSVPTYDEKYMHEMQDHIAYDGSFPKSCASNLLRRRVCWVVTGHCFYVKFEYITRDADDSKTVRTRKAGFFPSRLKEPQN